MTDPAVTAEQARSLAREILQRPEYAEHRRDPTFLQRWVDALSDWLAARADVVASWVPDWLAAAWNGFWSGLQGLLEAAFGQDAIVVVLRLAVAALVLGALALLAHRMLRALRAGGGSPAQSPARPVDDGPRLIDEANRLARAGRFLEAAHCTQLASLQLLLHERWLELERSDPNRVLRRRLQDAALPEWLQDRFLLLLDQLEGRWFRDRGEDRDLYGEWRTLHRQIEALPGRR